MEKFYQDMQEILKDITREAKEEFIKRSLRDFEIKLREEISKATLNLVTEVRVSDRKTGFKIEFELSDEEVKCKGRLK